MQHEPDEVKAITLRMKKAHGHLARVIAMMDQGADCDDVLTQLAAVNKALSRSGFALVAHCLQHCLAAEGGVDSLDVKTLEKLFLALA